MSCWSSEISVARPFHLSLSVCRFSSISFAATILKLREEILVLGTLETVTFFKLVPKKAELGTEAPAPVLFKLSCNIHSSHSLTLFKPILKIHLLIKLPFYMCFYHYSSRNNTVLFQFGIIYIDDHYIT